MTPADGEASQASSTLLVAWARASVPMDTIKATASPAISSQRRFISVPPFGQRPEPACEDEAECGH